MDFKTKISQLLNHNYSPRTAVQYFRTITQYVCWLNRSRDINSEAEIQTTSPVDVLAYLSTLPIDISSQTRNAAIAAIAAMYRLIDHPLSLAHLRARNKRSDKRYPVEAVNEVEVRQIILDLKPPNSLILNLLFYSGLTLDETLNLAVSDIDLANLTGGRASLSQWSADRLKIWIEGKQLSTDQKLFKAANRRNLYDALNACVNRKKMYRKNITPISFRYGGAVAMWQRGATDAEVREFLGCSAGTVREYKRRLQHQIQ